jgi:NADH:ubiquinone oxidoreductase subunit 5 (subunit L)/multisubunit Na+/H+ antiporter MnhA subunit
MDAQTTALAIIAVPLLGSLIIPVLGWVGRGKLTGPASVALIAIANALSFSLLGPALRGATASWRLPLYAPFVNFSLTIDALAVFMAITA